MKKVHETNSDRGDLNRLCVRGATLRPIKPPVSELARWGTRTVRLFPEDLEEDTTTVSSEYAPVKLCKTVEKKVLPLHVTNCRSAGVRSGLLRQIHETVEIDDFRRLLDKLIRVRGDREHPGTFDAFLSRSYIDALHRDLNGHMEVLRNLGDTSEDDSEPFKTTTTTD